ncbi:hypothetical protein [Christiangramia salexigens]|uniref:Tail specific protease domain-containing protein n=1 Tax=Christiangramia salexigens TaxID=1913577 RepID=A0A1L3J433_9FLAO|nr:hypothetical protein [Christiangramia salexigens]APG59863.1 hypothetical protein LPB144_05290 [Christiangramia salexigens]
MKNLYLIFGPFIFAVIGCGEQQTDIYQSEKTRIEKWIEDIAYFENDYLKESKTFSKDSIASSIKLLTSLKTKIGSLSDNEIILQLSKCVAMANNGHTTIHLSGMDKIPVRFYWFSDGLYIIKTDKSSEEFLGSKVLNINSIEIDTVLKRLKPYLSGIDRFKKFIASNYLTSPQILNGIGLTAPDSMRLTLLKGKDALDVCFGIKEMPDNKYEYETWADLYPDWTNSDSWEYFLKRNDSLPLYLKHMNEGVFYTFLDSKKIAYFSINSLWYKSGDFKEQIEEFLDELKRKRDYNIVFDLRYYTGGDYLIPTKLATKPPRIINKDKKIYLITSSMTFSAGLVTAARIKYFAKDKIVIVGEEVGDNLKFWAEGDYYKTPNFVIEIQDSKYEHDWKDNEFILGRTFWINAFYGVPAENLDLDKKIQLSFKDFQDGNDPILDWIFIQ